MKVLERAEARRLRMTGCSIKEIARTLRVGVASVSAWVSDIKLTEEQIRVLEERQQKSRRCLLERGRRLRLLAAAVHEQYRKEGYEKAKEDQEFAVICALYWGEGTKGSKNRYFALSNADPRLLGIVFRWLVASGYGERISFRVQYYGENGLSEADITSWWMEKIPGLEDKHIRKFTKNIVNRASQRKKQGKLPYGTATLYVCNVQLYFRLMGGIDYLAEAGT